MSEAEYMEDGMDYIMNYGVGGDCPVECSVCEYRFECEDAEI